MTLTKIPAGALIALLLLNVSSRAGPTLDTLAPDDHGRGRLGGFTFLWATAGEIAPVDPDTLEVDAAAVFFSGSDFLGIDALHDRGYRSLGTVADAVAGDAVPQDPTAGSLASSSAFVATADEDDTKAAAGAVPPSPGDPASAAPFTVVVPPPPDAASSPVGGRNVFPSGASPWSRQPDRPPAVSPATLVPSRNGSGRASPSSTGPASAGPPSISTASDHEPPFPVLRGSASVFTGGSAAAGHEADGVRQWLLADLVARNPAFAPDRATASRLPVEDFQLAGAQALDPVPPGGLPPREATGSDAANGSVVALPMVPFPTLDTALGANIRVYANPNTGISILGRLQLALQALLTLTVPEIISIVLATSGLAGLAVVWRHRRRREALAYRLDP